MLDAYLRKAARLPTDAQDTEGRRVVEDVITSCLFTPLKFMSPDNVVEVLSWFVGLRHRGMIDRCEVEFWPRFASANESTNLFSVEPDIIVNYMSEGCRYRVIIEIKWDAVLTRQQLENQLASCVENLRIGINCFHVSIVKNAELAAF